MALTTMTLVSRYDVDHISARGWVRVRNVASDDEIAAVRPAISSTVKQFAVDERSLDDRDTYGKAFLQVTDLWRKNETVKAFVFTRRFAQIAADLLGVERVRLYHDQALFKEPGGGPTPWHQDMYYWPLATEKAITMWMPLVKISPDMGLMRFAEGSHIDRRRTDLEISDESEAFYSAKVSENGYRVDGPETMRAGDATFHLGWTIHSAGPNLTTDRMREVMTVIYFPDGTRIHEPANQHQHADLSAFLGGRRPGDLADSDQNPVLN